MPMEHIGDDLFGRSSKLRPTTDWFWDRWARVVRGHSGGAFCATRYPQTKTSSSPQAQVSKRKFFIG
jgi:hypothetical protein